MILRSIALALLVLFAPAIGAVSKKVIFLQGDDVPGDPEAATWGDFSEPCVDKDGGLVAQALTDRDLRIIYKPLGGEVVSRVVSGQSVSVQGGAASDVSYFPTDGHRTVRATSQGRQVMYARLPGTQGSPWGWNAIVYADAAGLRVVARLGDFLPGTTQPIAELNPSVQLDLSGNVVFGARGINESFTRVLRWSPNGVETIWPSPKLMPGFTASKWLVSNSGEIVALGTLESAGAPPKQELVRWTPAGASVIARQGDPIPGRFAETFASFQFLNSSNAAGDVLFVAQARPLSYPYPPQFTGTWLARPNGAIDFVAATPATSVVNAAGDVALFWEGLQLKREGQEMETIVASPDERPEFRGLFSRLCLDARGGVVFQTNAGIWFRAPSGSLVSVARPYETITHNGSEYSITNLRLTSFYSGGEDGLPRALNDWGQIAFVASISKISGPGNSIPLNALMLATIPGGGDPAKKPVANADSAFFSSGVGVAVKLDVLANDVNPTGAQPAIETVTQGAFGKVSIRNGLVYYTPSKLFRGGDSFRYTASNAWGLSEEAIVDIENPYLFNGGNYATEVFDGTTQVGTVSLTLSKAGWFTGRIQYGKRLLKLNGAFEGETYQQSFALENGETVTVSLHLQAAPNSAARLSGSIRSSSDTVFEIKSAARFGLPPETKAMKVTGQIRTEGDISLPKGIGFLVGSLSSSGAFISRGRLPDNHPFSASSRMRSDGSMPFDCAPYGIGRGRLHGLFSKGYAAAGMHRWDASLKWMRTLADGASGPAPINGTVEALFATYAPSALRPAISNNGPIATGMITVNPDGEWSFNEMLSWSQRDAVVFSPPNLNRLQMRVNRGTGMVSGSYVNSSQELRRLSGVIFSLGNGTVGLISGGESTGSFVLSAN